MKDIVVGIDLGTTNSEVAVVENGQPRVIPDAANNKILPSVVGVGEDGGLLVGEAALNQYVLFPERTVKSIKRKMGSDEKMEMAGESYAPQEISAMILKRLKETAERYLRQPIHRAVITVPAYFNDAQRQATREAGEIAGLEVVRMINEPTAAALSYETGHREAKRILVYDLGGGTFDASVVQIQEGVVEVIASHGNNHLGGDDFDQEIVKSFVESIKGQHGFDVTQGEDSRKVLARLLRAAVNAKKTLSDRPYVNVHEEFLTTHKGVPINFSMELSRDEYEAMISPYIDETLQAVHIALQDAGLKSSDIDEILLVGGATRTPLVAWRLEEAVGLQPKSEIDPDLCVATGAAIQAAMIAGEKVDAVLVDVTPYTFGTSVFGELDGMPYPFQYAPIIKKNTPIPVSKSEVFFTMVENQERVDVNVYQGEDPDAKKNILIGEFTVEGLSKAPAHSPIVMHFDLDLNGILHVTAVEKKTGLKRSIHIDKAVQRMDRNELGESRQRLQALFGEAQEQAGPAPAKEREHAIIQAEALVEKAERMLDEAAEDDREEMIELIEAIKDALANRELEKLKEPMDQLADILYYLES